MTLKAEAKKYRNFINGEWVEPASGKYQASINPADAREIVGYAPLSTTEEVEAAIAAAKKASRSWARLSPVARGEYLRKAADILEKRVDEIGETLTREMGKTLAEGKGETARGVAILRYYAGEGLRSTGEMIPSSDAESVLFTTRVPVGVVGLITPWNFPVAIPIWKLAPALIYGNTVVIKPALEATVTLMKVFECLQEAGFPPGVINLVSGSGSTVGNTIIEHPDVKAISFTGSNQVGRMIASKAVARGAKYQLELGGKNPSIISKHADLDLAAQLTVNAAMMSTGQKCTATSRAIVVKDVYDEFKEKVLEKVRQIKVGNGLDPETYMGPVASKSQFDSVLAAIEKGKAEGATLLFGGEALTEGELAHGYYIQPTVFEDVTPDMSLAQEEIFGPVLAMIKVDDFDQAIEVANGIKYGLSASLFTTRLDEAFTYMREIEAGVVRVNGESSGVELQAPFGGMKESSSHSREQGRAAMEFFTSIKTVTMKG